MANIFIIEDDERLEAEVETLLTRNGHDVTHARDFAHPVSEALDADADLVLLDLTLPEVDGQVVCRELRHESTVPIIILTSRDNDLDELLSMSTGADDFIAKPFNPQILLAHIDALLRRAAGNHADSQRIEHAGVVLDMARGTVSYSGGAAGSGMTTGDRTADLTRNEMHLLFVLMSRAGSIVSRAELQEALWQTDEFVDDNTLTVNITRLRAALSSVGVDEGFLQTKRGMGYLVP